jgi:hypothetical protein
MCGLGNAYAGILELDGVAYDKFTAWRMPGMELVPKPERACSRD